VSSGTLDQYFRTREAMLASWEVRMMQRSFAELVSLVEQERALGTSVEDLIRAAVKHAVRLTLERLWMPKGEEGGMRSFVAEREPLVAAAVEALAHALRRSSVADRLRHEDVGRALRTAVYVAVFAPHPVALRGGDAAAREAIGEDLADMLVRCLLRNEQGPRKRGVLVADGIYLEHGSDRPGGPTVTDACRAS
jgi:AcrR family transcriptional regulator